MNKLALFGILLLVVGSESGAQSSQPETGRASYYGDRFHGLRTASGERFDMHKFTAAHRRLPFGTLVKVTNLRSQKSVTVRINDRGPFIRNRIIDVSKAAAKEIGLIGAGSALVSLEIIKANSPALPDSGSISGTNNENLATANYLPGNTYNMEGNAVRMKGYGFQTGTHTDLTSAREACRNLISKGENDVFIQVARGGSGKIYRIIVRNFRDKSTAEESRNCLSEIGAKGFIRAF